MHSKGLLLALVGLHKLSFPRMSRPTQLPAPIRVKGTEFQGSGLGHAVPESSGFARLQRHLGAAHHPCDASATTKSLRSSPTFLMPAAGGPATSLRRATFWLSGMIKTGTHAQLRFEWKAFTQPTLGRSPVGARRWALVSQGLRTAGDPLKLPFDVQSSP
jgi:hypothetical protein